MEVQQPTFSDSNVETVASAFVTARKEARAIRPGELPPTLSMPAARGAPISTTAGKWPAGRWPASTPDFRDKLGASRLAGPIFRPNVRELMDGGMKIRLLRPTGLPR